jgi:hypothetical protein
MGVGGQRPAQAALPPEKKPGTPCTRGWVGSRAGMDECVKSRSHWDSITGQSFYHDYLSRPRLYNVGSNSKNMLLNTPGKSIINFPWHTHWKTLVKFTVLVLMPT